MNGITRVARPRRRPGTTCICPAMLLDRGVGGVALVAERGADLLGDLVEPVAAPLERDQRRLLGALHLARDVEPRGLVVLLLGLHAVAGDVRLQVLRRVAAALGEQLEERRADLARGLVADRGDLAVVVLAARSRWPARGTT